MPSPRRRARTLYDKAALGTYRGPAITPRPPRVTAHVVRILRSIQHKLVKAGQRSHTGQWRLDGENLTVTCERLIGCGWAVVVGAHLELTPAGVEALDTAQREEEK